MKSSSTMKVVDQESIRQRNSKPTSRETHSNQHKHSKSVGKKKSNKHKRIQTISSKCCRTPIGSCNPRKILKWTKKSNVDLMTSLTEENSAKQYQQKTSRLLKNLTRCSGKEVEEKSLLHHWLRSFYGGQNQSRKIQCRLH